MVFNPMKKSYIFFSVTIKCRVILRSICSKCQNAVDLRGFIIFPSPFYTLQKFCFILYYVYFASNFKHLGKQGKGSKHINKSNNYSLCFRSLRSALKNHYSGYLFRCAFQNARLYMESLSLHITEIQIKDH